MPPKRKKTPWETFLDEHEDDGVTLPAQVSQSLLEEAYSGALNRPSEACKKERAQRAQRQQEQSQKGKGKDDQGSSKAAAGSDSEVEVVSASSNNKGASGGTQSCNTKNCEHKPACLNWTGGSEEWEPEAKAFKTFRKRLGLGADPSTAERNPKTLVGLKNLGATCYANSYLQVWFQNRQFRSAVYRCVPSTSAVKLEDLPLFQLQVTFSALQQGPTNVFNPKPLVQSLRLKEEEQQDSSEFGKLFLGLLDSQFARQEDPSLKSVVSDLFAGEMIYGTRCHGCKQSSERGEAFYELEINLKANCVLEERIDSLFQEEELSGSNQYRCERCDGLRDATRFTRLGSLPPVLHFSLLRFIYDYEAEERRKTNVHITFPAELDMSLHVPSSPGQSQMYDLAGVLLHHGTSAYHGHYTADVYDGQQEKWFHCDDASVQAISSPFKKRKEMSRASSNKNKSNPGGSINGNGRKAKKIEISEDESAFEEQSVIRSKDAYMLVYVRRDSNTSIPEPKPTPEALDQVSKLFEEIQKKASVYKGLSDAAKAVFDEARSEKQKLYSCWWPSSYAEPTFFVSSSQLKKFMTRELHLEHKLTADKQPAEDVSKPSEQPTPGQPEVSGSVETSTRNGDMPPEASTSAADCASIALEKSSSAPPDSIDNSDVVCPHGKLKPESAGDVRRVSKDFVGRLADLQVSMQPPLEVSKALCAECIASVLATKGTLSQHERDVAQFKKYTSTMNGTSFSSQNRRYWISKPWLDDWRKLKPSMVQPDGSLPPPDAEPWKTDVQCQHDRLQPSIMRRKDINEKEYQFLVQKFPNWTSLDKESRKCHECSTESQMMSPEQLQARAAKEKSGLANLVSDPARVFKLEPPVKKQSVLVPRDFLRSWKAWVKRPLDYDRPDRVDLTSLRCDHDQVALDPNNKVQMQEFSNVSPDEWQSLQDYHPTEDFVIKITAEEENKFTFDPPMCRACHDKRLQAFEEATIQVLILNDADFDMEGYKRPIAEYEPPKEKPKAPLKDGKLDFSNGSTGLRRSGRARNAEEKKSKERKVQAVDVKKGDRVLDLKLQLEGLLKISPLFQRVWFRDQELDKNQVTMSEAGIHEGAVVELFETEILDDEELAKYAEKGGHDRKRQKSNREGFSSTGLFGYDTPGTTSEGAMDVDPPEDNFDCTQFQEVEAGIKICPQCTLHNELDATECMACEMPFVIT